MRGGGCGAHDRDAEADGFGPGLGDFSETGDHPASNRAGDHLGHADTDAVWHAAANPVLGVVPPDRFHEFVLFCELVR
ncbi:hypothetical protein [Catenulispora pinisilvae]|uniref:hypothetical protein n=1 Tax=Catenulispora pinisilvae TaxID=2705253 RepID=UPI001891A62B|nr:hypothetical protein [Catenulispora pinisilvae]